jgi:hypothetical protein
LYLYCPDLLYPYQVLYSHYTLPRKLPFSGQCERLSRRLVINKKAIVYWYTMHASKYSAENQNSVRYSDSTSYLKKYSSSKCKQTVCLHYGPISFPEPAILGKETKARG